MTDEKISEEEFMPYVRSWLRERFPHAEISSTDEIGSDRVPDYVVLLGRGTAILMVEVENCADDVQSGLIQAQIYAGARQEASGMVIYPSGTGEVEEEVIRAEPSVGVFEVGVPR